MRTLPIISGGASISCWLAWAKASESAWDRSCGSLALVAAVAQIRQASSCSMHRILGDYVRWQDLLASEWLGGSGTSI